MHSESSPANAVTVARSNGPNLTISRWVNEPYPPLNELLSSRDVARLTRRPRWVLSGLSLIGRFPKKFKFRGRGIGWRRSEVLEWISREAHSCAADRWRTACSPGHPIQRNLTLRCAPHKTRVRKCSSRPDVISCNRGSVVRSSEERRS